MGRLTLVGVGTSGVVAWSPADVTIWAWYDADLTIDGTYASDKTIRDYSGNGRHLTQATASLQATATTFNGRDVLYFDTLDDFATVGIGTLAQPFSIITCIHVVDAPETFASIISSSAGTVQVFSAHSTNLGKASYQASGLTPAVGNAPVTAAGDDQILSVIFNGASSLSTWNGNLTPVTDNPGAFGIASDLKLGQGSSGGTALQMGAYFCAAAIIDSVLSTGDRQKFEGYFAHRYGMAAALPALHPYKSSPP